MSYLKGEKMLFKYTYDFAKQGGAIGTVPLPEVAGNKLDSNCRIVNAYAIVETPLASGGVPTITFGPSSVLDGYFVDCWPVLSGPDQAIGTGERDGALIWDTGNDTPRIYKPLTEANDAIMVIGANALTAGKLSFYLEVLL